MINAPFMKDFKNRGGGYRRRSGDHCLAAETVGECQRGKKPKGLLCERSVGKQIQWGLKIRGPPKTGNNTRYRGCSL